MRIKKRTFIIYVLIMIAVLAIFSYCIYVLEKEGLSNVGIAVIMIYVLNFLITIFIFSQERQVKAKLSWLMAFAILPFVSHILFLILGQRYGNVKTYQKYLQSYYLQFEKQIGKGSNRFLNHLSWLTRRGVYRGDFTFYSHGNDAYEQIFNDIKQAQHFIHLHFYIIKYGEIYDMFKQVLIAKAKQGLEVRMIVDDFGRWALPSYEIKALRAHGISVQVFAKVNYPFLGSRNGFRTHRKLVIIDGQIAHVGGLNIADEYASLATKYGHWCDFGARIEGQAMRSLNLLFMEDWYQMTNQKLVPSQYVIPSQQGQNEVIMIEGTPETEFSVLELVLVNMICKSEKKIVLASPYLVPTEKIISALSGAALAGVDVTIYIPGRPDKKIPFLATHYYAAQLQRHGVKIRKMNGMFLHSKLGLFDDKYAYFGTMNIDIRSLYSQFELINIFTGPQISGIKTIFNEYYHNSNLVPSSQLKLRGIKRILRKFIVELFSSTM